MKNDDRAVLSQGTANTTPVAIIGMGSMYPEANNTTKFWTNIKNRVDAITEVPESHWHAADYYDPDPKVADKVYAKLGGFLSPVEFNPMEFGILPNAIEAIDTSQLLGLLTVDQALKDAGYSAGKEFNTERVSVILGITGTLELVVPLGARLGYPRWKEALKDAGVDDELAADVVQRISDSYVPWQENSFPGLLGNVVAGRISKHFNFGGTNCTVDAACGSSLGALNLATLELTSGRSDMVVAGGIDTFNDIFMYTCFSKTPALSPSGHARPYSSDSDGTTLGEGLGIVILKRLEDAERDGDNIYAVIKGIGASSDGRGSAIYEPNAQGQAKALRRAYEQGGVSPETIELIEGHGTGTKVGDAIEVEALHEIFGTAEKPWCALGSIKSQIGHTKAAAGVAGLIKTSLALYHKVLPPTIKVDTPPESLATDDTPFYVNTEARPWITAGDYPRRAGVSALGFGGSNFHCLLEEYQDEKRVVDWAGDVQILPFSAADIDGLRQELSDFSSKSDWAQLRLAGDKLRRQYRADSQHRLILVVEDGQTNRETQLKNALAMLETNSGKQTWETPNGIYYAAGKISGKVAMLFPGQGAQYPGMLKDLALQFPEFLTTLADGDRAFSANSQLPLGTLFNTIYPYPKFTPEAKLADEEALRATQLAQPALGTVSLAAGRVLARFGLTADAVAGHSYGELMALCAAEVFTTADLYQLSRLRGELMAGVGGDRGSMVAVSAPLLQVEKFIEDESLDLVLANKNTPEQVVLSGATAEVERAMVLLKERGFSHKELAVSAAFHSPLIADAAQPFAAKLADIIFKDPRKEVYSNTTGTLYPANAAAVRDVLADQLASPVDFVHEIKSMYDAGQRVFVEVGPGARLSGMVKAILGDSDYHVVALDSSNGRRSGINDLARALAKLSSLGLPIDLTLWDGDFVATLPQEGVKKKGLTVSICGANYYKRPEKRPPLQVKQQRVAPVDSSSSSPKPQPQVSVAPPVEPAVSAPQSQITAGGQLHEALQLTQQSMQALQNLQEQTAKLHQQFLEGQQAATRSFMQLVDQQREMLQGSPVTMTSSSVAPASVAPLASPVPSGSAPSPEPVTSVVDPAPAPSTSPAAESVAPAIDVAPLLLEIIAEKTGYPVEMLELNMALDTDLGIDSIKRVEILSALQEKIPEAPVIRPEDLGALQTLGQIVTYLDDNMDNVPVPPPTVSAGGDRNQVSTVLLDVIAEKTGYPVEMLELNMALDTDLGIDSIKRVEILSALQEKLPELPAVRPEDLGVLQTLGQIIDHLCESGQVSTPTASASPQAASAADRGQVSSVLLGVIAEKTGYPVEMLELDMALDTDLGIDSIKRVEILSALQEKLPDLPAVRPEDLGVLQTLGQIIDHLCKGEQLSTPIDSAESAGSGQLDRSQVAAVLLDVIAEKTGYPVEMLELNMALDTDLGIDSIKRVEILSALQAQLPGAPAIKPEHLGTLQTVGQIVDFLASISGSGTAEINRKEAVSAPKGIVREMLKAVSLPQKRAVKDFNFDVVCEVWVTDDGSTLSDTVCSRLTDRQLIPRKISLNDVDSLNVPDSLVGLIVIAPLKGSDDSFHLKTFSLLQKAEPALQARGRRGGSFFATVSRINGYFGADFAENINDYLSGGLAGLTKTVALECPSVHCKAIDLAMGMEILPTAIAIVDEIFSVSPLEVGITTRGLYTLELVKKSVSDVAVDLPINSGELVVVSGGARGVTAEVAVALSQATKATLLLLGRSPVPATEPAWLSQLHSESEIKKGLIARADGPLKPVDVEKQYQQVIAAREIQATLERILKAGGTAIYRSVDLRDKEVLSAIIDEVRSDYGAVRGVIHGAGVLADKLISEKTRDQFKLVYSTKVDGLRSLVEAVKHDELKFMVLFSSSTGRFGRIGQCDYAVANEILNKFADQFSSTRPDCRVVACNWGPWDGGMVTPALKKVFAQEGIDVIDLQAGANYLLHELSTEPGSPVELVISGGIEEEINTVKEEPAPNICVSKAFDLELNVEQYPFLKSHVIDGKAVLPMAIIIEWLAHGAVHNNPGLVFQGFNDLRILKGVKLDSQQSITLQVMTGKAIKGQGVHVVPVELTSTDENGQSLAHARARIVLASRLPAQQGVAEKLLLGDYPHHVSEIYCPERLFHGDNFHGIREVTGASTDGISALVNPAPLPEKWISQPLRNSWFADPLALDSSFQLLILWSFEQYQAGSLPVFAERYRQFQTKFPETGVEVRVALNKQSNNRALADIDFVDPLTEQLVARIENYECVIDSSLNATFQRNKLTGVA